MQKSGFLLAGFSSGFRSKLLAKKVNSGADFERYQFWVRNRLFIYSGNIVTHFKIITEFVFPYFNNILSFFVTFFVDSNRPGETKGPYWARQSNENQYFTDFSLSNFFLLFFVLIQRNSLELMKCYSQK